MDPRVKAIREHPKVGRGTCTTVDECFDTKDLIENLDRDGVKTPEEAIQWALDFEGLKLEQALNARWGSDDDPQLKAYRDFHKEEA